MWMQLLTWKCLEDLASAEWPYSYFNCNLNNKVPQCIPGWQYCHNDETWPFPLLSLSAHMAFLPTVMLLSVKFLSLIKTVLHEKKLLKSLLNFLILVTEIYKWWLVANLPVWAGFIRPVYKTFITNLGAKMISKLWSIHPHYIWHASFLYGPFLLISVWCLVIP